MSEMSHSQQGIRTMEANAASNIAASQETEAYAMDSTFDQEALDSRKASPEISVLNDMAQIEIWGTNGKTEGFVDPITGKPLTAPIKGVLEEIRENRRYGTTEAEREMKASDVETEIVGLVDEGFELSQAKLIWDMRQNDDKSAANMISKYIAGGMSATDAESKVRKVYSHKDSQRLDIIQNEGIFTEKEYKNFLEGDSKSSLPEEDDTKILQRDQDKIHLTELTKRVNDIRNEYARLSAGRGRRFGGQGEFSESKVAEARKAWEESKALRNELIAHELKMALAAGVSEEDLMNYLPLFSIGDNESMARSLYDQRLLATGDYKVNSKSGELDEVEPKGIHKWTRKFYKWWGKQSGEKLLSTATLKKSGAMIFIGIPVGAGAALVGSTILGPIAGGALGAVVATKLAKGLMSYHINKKSKHDGRIDRLHQDLSANAHDLASGDEGFADSIDSQTSSEVRANKRRVAIGVGLAALGGAIGAVGTEHIVDTLSNQSGSTVYDGSGSTVSPINGMPNIDGHPATSTIGSAVDHVQNHAPHNFGASLGFRGDTIWNEVEERLHHNGISTSDHNVYEATAATLKANGVSWDQARDLPVGFRFDIPQEALDRLSKS